MKTEKTSSKISDEALEKFAKELRLLYEKYKDDKSEKVDSTKRNKGAKK